MSGTNFLLFAYNTQEKGRHRITQNKINNCRLFVASSLFLSAILLIFLLISIVSLVIFDLWRSSQTTLLNDNENTLEEDDKLPTFLFLVVEKKRIREMNKNEALSLFLTCWSLQMK